MAATATKIPEHIFRRVERALYDYRANKAAVKAFEAEQEELRRSAGGRQFSTIDADAIYPQGGHFDPTYRLTVHLLRREAQIARPRYQVAVIEAAMGALSDVQRQIVERKYFDPDKPSDRTIAEEIGIDRATLYRHRDEIVRTFAIAFGWWHEWE